MGWKFSWIIGELGRGFWDTWHLGLKRVTFKISMKYLEIISANCVAPSIKILWVLAHLNNLLRFQVTIERIIPHKKAAFAVEFPKIAIENGTTTRSLFQPKFNARNFFGSSQFNKKSEVFRTNRNIIISILARQFGLGALFAQKAFSAKAKITLELTGAKIKWFPAFSENISTVFSQILGPAFSVETPFCRKYISSKIHFVNYLFSLNFRV